MKTNLRLRILSSIVVMVISIGYSSNLSAQCNVNSLSPSTINAPGSGGEYSVYVNTGGCTTYYVSNNSFATYTKNGLTVTVTVPANTGSSRSGVMLIGSKPLVVNQACGLPVAPTSATSDRNNICYNAGGNISLSATDGSGETLRWLSGSCAGSSVGTGNPLSISAPTTTTIYYAKWQNSCGSSGCAPVTVTVKALPTAPTSGMSNYNNFCAGTYSTITLTAYGGSGTTLKWSLNACSPAYCATGTTATVPAPYVTSTYYAYWENDCGSSGCLPVTVTVSPSGLQPSSVTSNHNDFCAGAYPTIILSATGGSGTTLRWFAGSCSGTDLGTGNNKEITAPTSTTSYFARWENSCGNSLCTSVTVNILSLPSAPTSAASNYNNFCPGTVGNITLTASGGSGETLRWFSGSCTGSSVGTGNPLVIPAPTTTTTYYSRWENSCGNSGCRPVTVTVKALAPPTTVMSNYDSFCAGTYSTITLTAYGGTGTTLKWSLNACSPAYCATGTTASVPAPVVTSIYYAHWENDCGSSDCLPVIVTILPSANQPTSITSDRYRICTPGGNISLTANGGSGTTLHWFTDPNGTPIATNTNPLVITAPTSTTTYYARWETSCGNSGFASVPITVGTPTVPTIQGYTSLCSNSEGNIYTTESGMSYYYWNVTNGFIRSGGGISDNTATVTWASSGTGHIKVNYTNSAGCTVLNQTDLPVILNALPSPSITGLPISCLNGTRTYVTETGKDNYLWTITGGSFISGLTTNTVSVVWDQVGIGHIKVNYTNLYGCTAQLPYDYPVTVNQLPNPTINGPTTVCLNQESTYTTQEGASNYSWSIIGGEILSANNYTVTVKWTASGIGHIKVDYTDTNGCSASASFDYPVTVNALPSPVISGLTAVCSESEIVYSTATGMSDYSWTVIGGVRIAGGGSTNNTATVKWGETGTGHVKINYINANLCTSPSLTDLSVTVNELPLPPSITGATSILLNSTGNVYITESGMSSYIWDIEGGTITTGGELANNTATVTWTGPCSGAIKLNYTNAAGCFGVTQTVFPVSIIRTGSSDQNYIRTKTAREAFKSSLPEAGDPSKITTEYVYFDGLGRPIQTVQVKGSPLMGDIVTYIEYDPFGRQKFDYLPYAKSDDPCNNGAFVNDAATNQLAFYSTSLNDSYPFSEKVFENSPLNRIIQLGSPGAAWQPGEGHTVDISYITNTASEVKLWNIINDSICQQNNTYSAGQLYVNQTTDENGHRTKEYRDKESKVVLKKSYNGADSLQTYYVYDDFGLLRYVISPKAANGLALTTLNPGDAVIRQLCYYYEYDSRKRMIVKQLPGTDPVYLVYDLRDRLVAVQDGKMRDEDDSWLFTKYDVFNRPVLTGKYLPGVELSQSQMQSRVDYYYAQPGNLFFASRTNVQANMGYDLNSFPGENISDYYTATYYDDYSYSGFKGFNTSVNISGYSDADGNTNYFDNVKTLVTGTKTLVLDGGTDYLFATTYYDDKYRPIQVTRDIYDGAAGLEVISSLYDFIGQLMETKVSQLFNNVTSTVSKYYTYDHMGRLLKTGQQIVGDGNGKVTLASMDYNELGQLIRKDLHSTSTTLPLQSVDYQYNIRGWLTQINSPDNLGIDLFAIRLQYNDTETGLNNTGQYNGNITGMVWNSAGKAKQGYAFAYDSINRLTVSDYKTNNGSTWTESTAYEEKGITYDKNGNIGTLQRSNSGGTISDNYTYSYTGNQLMNISSGSTYTYDKNGNMTFDGLRGLNLTYNILNLPATITRGTDNLSYIYSATGEKLAKLKNSVVQQYYTGNMVYNSSKALDYILNEEGMVKKATAYTYEYYLKDHLGNTRVVFSTPSGITINTEQVDEYYPFGLSYRPISPDNGNKYLYNGKELQDESLGGVSLDWYDFQTRFYDPQIGRFNSLDILADTFRFQTPYAYAINNPIRFIDVKGMGPGDLFLTTREAAIDWGKTYNGVSIIKQKELGSSIYKVRDGIGTSYSYNVPSIGKAHSNAPNPIIPINSTATGDIHSHGNDDVGYNDNQFSGIPKSGSNITSTNGDIGDNNRTGKTGYLTTPNGSLQEYEPKTGTITTVSTKLPSDPKDPTRLNTIEPTRLNVKPPLAPPSYNIKTYPNL